MSVVSGTVPSVPGAEPPTRLGLDRAPEPNAHLGADVVLLDGATARVRPITPADAPELQRFHMGQSAESIYLRFFAAMPRLSESDLHRFTHVDLQDRLALVCLIGDQIVGVGRYDRVSPASADVAFNVSDAHHGRGIGALLLEHLAAAARERGINRFVADVLPQNFRMLSVFTEAGYTVHHHLEDGVVSVSIDIAPTDRTLAVMEAREHRAESRSVQALLSPRGVVVFGASRRRGTIGHRMMADLVGSAFTGRLAVVHPEAESVHGVTAYRSLAEVPWPVDLAVVAVPAAAVLDVVSDCARYGVRGLVVISGGFAETGAEGQARQRELVRLARGNGMRVVGPNSWGIINADPAVRLNVSLVRRLPNFGRLALFCQSGAMTVSVLDFVARRRLGLSTFVSAGNRADVSGNDCMQFWQEDPATDVVGLYLESVGNPRKFSRIARRLSRIKPVIVLTSGESAFGAPPGHLTRTSLAPRESFDAMLRQSGCIRVENVHQLFDVAQLLTQQPLPQGPAVAVVANSDTLAALIADVCTSWKLKVEHGPVALHPQAASEEFRTALRSAVSDERINAVVAAFVPPVGAAAVDIADALAEISRASRVPVVACLMGMDEDAGPVDAKLRAGTAVPTYRTPEEAVRALATVVRYGAWRSRPIGIKLDPPGCDPQRAVALVESALEAEPHGVELDQAATTALLACYGLTLWPERRATDEESAVRAAEALGYPVALKTTAAHLRHRADLGGVRLDIADSTELRADVASMREQLQPLGASDLVVQRMAPPGVACVVRSVEDPLFGPVVSFGLGGDASELLGDVSHRIPPLTDVDVADLVRSVRAAPKLFGHRGARPVDVRSLEDVIARVSRLADDLPEAARVELNPVVVSEHGAAVLGAQIRLLPDPGRADAGRRELTSE